MGTKRLSKRLVNYDILRILAAYLIVVLHLSVQYISKAPTSVDEYLQWQQAVKLSALSRVGVPIFVMLSGAFLLNSKKMISLADIFRKYLPKLIAIFLFWSFFYSLSVQGFFENLFNIGFSASCDGINWNQFWLYFPQGHYHMWYLYMLAGLYLITPLIKHITAQATQAQLIYFVFLCVLVTSLTKLNQELWHAAFLDTLFDKLSLSFFFGYIGYFVAGYLFRTYTPGWRISTVIFVIGILSLRYTYQKTWLLNPMFGFDKPNLVFFSNYSPTVFFMSFAVFLLFVKLGEAWILNPSNQLQRFMPLLSKYLAKISGYLLVVYLVHPFIIIQCRNGGLLQSPASAWSLPVNAFIVYVISLAVSIVLTQTYQLVFHHSKC